MIVKGRCRGNGSQLANYLLDTSKNGRADFLTSRGSSHPDPRWTVLEMSLTSEITGRTDAGLYHMQLSPRESEAAEMTWEQKMRCVQITAEKMGLDGHRWALFEHENDERIHMHLVFERYNHTTRRMWSDNQNYEKHYQAARQMEIEFGWQLTHEHKNHLDRDIKDHITDLWLESQDGRGFVQAMHKSGFEVTQGIDRRPYQVVDQFGTVHDLSRQLLGFNQRQVSEYLNGIRHELRLTAEASQDRRQQYQQTLEPVQSDNMRELSESQDVFAGMKLQYKQTVKEPEKPATGYSYSFKIYQTLTPPPAKQPEPPSLPRQPEEKTRSDKTPEKSQQPQRAERLQQMQQNSVDQTKQVEQEDSLTGTADRLLRLYRMQQRKAPARDREGPEQEYEP